MITSPDFEGDIWVHFSTLQMGGYRSLRKGQAVEFREVMTPEIRYCYLDQDVDEIAANMADIQVRRLPVINHDKRLVGILSLGDIATSEDPECATEALSGISRPTNGMEHCPAA